VSERGRFQGVVLESEEEHIVIESRGHLPALEEGQLIVISRDDRDYYAEMISADGLTLRAKELWSEKRGYFRVDDVFPVVSRKAGQDPLPLKSRVFPGYSAEAPESSVPLDAVSPQLWRMLVDINTKLTLILQHLHLENEGLVRAEQRAVNISASGLRFTVNEAVEIGEVIEVKMLLPTSPPVGILTYGTVVRVNGLDGGQYEIGLHFSEMDDDVRDEIIQYTLKRQREVIRKRRQQRGTDV
jgi:hypothetical protein